MNFNSRKQKSWLQYSKKKTQSKKSSELQVTTHSQVPSYSLAKRQQGVHGKEESKIWAWAEVNPQQPTLFIPLFHCNKLEITN